ncbi:MAG: NAD-dependent epimerase/dehydratase family protein [Spirochaetes bacterium]|nr:NAD-dependent epimerase/dehydratase family protein [Spirochaetota bacterium]
MKNKKRILIITGAFGYVGSRVIEHLKKSRFYHKIICTDIITPSHPLPSPFVFEHCDIRDSKKLTDIFVNHKVTDVLHLAYLILRIFLMKQHHCVQPLVLPMP